MIKPALLLLILLTVASILKAQGMPPTDIVLDSMITNSAEQIVQKIKDHSALVLNVSSHPDQEYVAAKFFDVFKQHSIEVKAVGEDSVLQIVINDLSTRYNAMEHDSIRRIITVYFTASITTGNAVDVLQTTPGKRVDEGLRRDALYAESRQHSASHGAMPEPESSFWDDIVEPAIFVAAAATTVVLLFTVRSK